MQWIRQTGVNHYSIILKSRFLAKHSYLLGYSSFFFKKNFFMSVFRKFISTKQWFHLAASNPLRMKNMFFKRVLFNDVLVKNHYNYV